MTRSRRRFPWAAWPRERLLDTRLCDLGVTLEGTWIEECLEDLYADLERRGLRFRPHAWLSTDWFSPGHIPGIAVPFYLAHPRLVRLERREMLEVEGGTREECLRILRHECGHAVQHAWLVHRRAAWRRHFGNSSKPYPEVYTPNPGSRRYVQHLRLYYAQSHPDEDFAETFAVWLQPRATWRRRYAGWPALRKLEYVDALMAELAATPPKVRSRARMEPVGRVRMTLREYYADKKQKYAVNFPDVYDRDLRRLFSDEPRHRHHQRASAFLRKHRAELRRTVARWTGEYEFALDQVLDEIIGRCRELGLRAVGTERRLLLDAAGMLAVKTVHHLYSRRVEIAL
jgi:hypothetical protein